MATTAVTSVDNSTVPRHRRRPLNSTQHLCKGFWLIVQTVSGEIRVSKSKQSEKQTLQMLCSLALGHYQESPTHLKSVFCVENAKPLEGSPAHTPKTPCPPGFAKINQELSRSRQQENVRHRLLGLGLLSRRRSLRRRGVRLGRLGLGLGRSSGRGLGLRRGPESLAPTVSGIHVKDRA